MTCTAMSGSGARIGLANIHRKTWLTTKDRRKARNVCCVADRLRILPSTAVRRLVTSTSPTAATTRWAFAFAFPWSEITGRSDPTRSLLLGPRWERDHDGGGLVRMHGSRTDARVLRRKHNDRRQHLFH